MRECGETNMEIYLKPIVVATSMYTHTHTHIYIYPNHIHEYL